MQKHLSTVGSNTYDKIKHDIVFGTLEPGSKLKLDSLKSGYQASVSTLREVLNRLASEGFVYAEEQRGFFVAPVSKDDLVEIANLRILLESHALRESIENGDAEWEGAVVAAHHKLSLLEQKMLSGDHSDKETWKQYDWEFHQALIQACNSKNLLALHATIFDKYLRYQMQVLSFRGNVAAKEHKSLLNAALERDIERADKILTVHIKKGFEQVVSTLKEQ